MTIYSKKIKHETTEKHPAAETIRLSWQEINGTHFLKMEDSINSLLENGGFDQRVVWQTIDASVIHALSKLGCSRNSCGRSEASYRPYDIFLEAYKSGRLLWMID